MAQMGILLNTVMCGNVNVFLTAVVSYIYRICYDAGNFQNNRLSASMDNVGIAFFFYRIDCGFGIAAASYPYNCLDNKNC